MNESLNKSTAKLDESLNKSKDSIKDELKYELPASCFITLMKSTKIEKLSKKYVLVAHPHPIFEGEMLLF